MADCAFALVPPQPDARQRVTTDRPVLAEHLKLKRSDAKSRHQWRGWAHQIF